MEIEVGDSQFVTNSHLSAVVRRWSFVVWHWSCAVSPQFQAAEPVEHLFQDLAVETDQIGDQADQEDLEPHDQQHCGEDQRLEMPGSLAGKVEKKEPDAAD